MPVKPPPFMVLPSPSKRRSTPRRGDRSTGGTAAADAADAAERLAYTEELLARYQGVVEGTLRPQLASYSAACDQMSEELELLRRENARVNETVRAAIAEADALRKRQDEDRRAFSEEKAALVRAHDGHLDALRRETGAQREALEDEVRRLQAEIARFTDATVRAADADAQRRADDMQKVLHLREAEVRRLRQMLAEKETALESAERHAVEAAPIARSIATALGELRCFVSEAGNAAATLSAAYEHIGIDAADLDECWRSVRVTQQQQQQQQQQQEQEQERPGDGDRHRAGAPATLRGSLDELATLVVAVRAAAQQEKACIGRCLRATVTKQSELVATLAAQEAEHHSENARGRRRLEELESDHRAERELLLQRAEKERLRSVLGGGGGGDVDVASGTVSSRGGGSPSLPGASVGGRRGAGGSGGSGSGGGGGGGGAPVATRTSAQQTGVELWELSLARAGGASDDVQTAKFRTEIGRLQDELAQSRETIAALERQRQHFMFFVDDDDIATDVQQVLSGSRASFMRFAF